jgi:opacity protein-like surface antigen
MLTRILAIALIVSIAPSAHAGITGLGFGIHGGLISNYDNPPLEQGLNDAFQDSIDFSFSKDMTNIGAHLIIGTLRVIEFDVNLDYIWKSQAVYQDVELRYSVFAATAAIRKSFSIGILSPYAGAGLGLYRSAYSLKSENYIIVLPSDETKLGYLLKGGLELNIPMFPLTPYAEFKYNHVKTSDDAIKFYQIIAGLTLNLP